VVAQEKIVSSILKLVAQCKIYFPFNLRVKCTMKNVQKQPTQADVKLYSKLLNYTNFVNSFSENIYILKSCRYIICLQKVKLCRIKRGKQCLCNLINRAYENVTKQRYI